MPDRICHADSRLPRGFHAGWIGWAIFCVLAVAVRGVRWDETYEHAQVLLGTVPYPPGHPLLRYVRGVYSVQPFLTALHLYLWPNEAMVNGLRNALMLAANVLPVYLLAAWLTRSVAWGFGAATLVLEGVLLEFDGSYPLVVWPDIFSNGPIGQGYAQLVLFLLLRRHDRIGGFLLGLFPCIHIGQAPALGLWGALWALWRIKNGGVRHVRGLAVWTCLGVVVAAGFALVPYLLRVPAPSDGPYAVEGNADAIWRGYTQFADPHRRLPSGNGHVALIAALALGVLLARGERNARGTAESPPAVSARPWTWLFVYVAVVATLVWVSMAIHMALGPRTPFLVLGWMPYRLINHVPPILLVMICGLIRAGGGGSAVFAAAVVYGAVVPFVLGESSTPARYLRPSVCLLFLVLGVAWGKYGMDDRAARWARLVAGLVSIAALGVYHQWGAVCVAVGVLAGIVATRWARAKPGERLLWIPNTVALLALATEQGMHRNHLPRSAFDVAAARLMADAGNAKAMVAGRPDEFTLQARTGHPVLVESATASLISYQPALGPTINGIYDEFYGTRFDRVPEDGRPSWEALWQMRTVEEWRRLAEAYEVRYLVAPDHLEMNLDPLLVGNGSRLYRIPRQEAGP